MYQIKIKKLFRSLNNCYKFGVIVLEEIERIYFYIDEHTTATNGKYELKEGLEQEFKYGTYNLNFSVYFIS